LTSSSISKSKTISTTFSTTITTSSSIVKTHSENYTALFAKTTTLYESNNSTTIVSIFKCDGASLILTTFIISLPSFLLHIFFVSIILKLL